MIGETNYSNFKFCSIVKKDNIIGMQFHPEKSGSRGLEILNNLRKNLKMKLNINNKAYYGLPQKVIFCKKSLISNQRPNSSIEFQHSINSKKKTLRIDSNGISDSGSTQE